MSDSQLRTITNQIIKAAQKNDTDKVDDLIDYLAVLARNEGKNDLLIDLWDGKEISAEAVEFAIENNGCKDPRR